ncbi:hypothetical protein [Crocosphaera sp. Alani8]|uniref:hypothetical protein n=1 Tax=Crocosphaera sp. Alani8 TaxID=3038952 RepID=UPI00313BC6D2
MHEPPGVCGFHKNKECLVPEDDGRQSNDCMNRPQQLAWFQKGDWLNSWTQATEDNCHCFFT